MARSAGQNYIPGGGRRPRRGRIETPARAPRARGPRRRERPAIGMPTAVAAGAAGVLSTAMINAFVIFVVVTFGLGYPPAPYSEMFLRLFWIAEWIYLGPLVVIAWRKGYRSYAVGLALGGLLFLRDILMLLGGT